ncbi:MAG: Thermostable monoacylglycerol lipase [Desulfovibrio sp.]
MTSPDRSQPACLLIHGYRGSPLELENLAAALEAAGIATRVPCLPGHGPDTDTFASRRFTDWLACAEDALAALRAAHDRVAVIGFSMGGTLALNLAARFPVAGVVTLSAPLYVLHVSPWPVQHAIFYGSSALAQVGRLFKRGKKEPEKGEPSRDTISWKGYDGPLNIPQLFSFRQGCIATRKLLPNLTAPLLAMHDAGDKIVYSGNACEIARRVASRVATVVYTRIRETNTRRHMIITHEETKTLVIDTVTRFCRESCFQ